jgi:hypothetical protein
VAVTGEMVAGLIDKVDQDAPPLTAGQADELAAVLGLMDLDGQVTAGPGVP